MTLHWLAAGFLAANYLSYLFSVSLVFRPFAKRNNPAFWTLVVASATTWGVSIQEFVDAAPFDTFTIAVLAAVQAGCTLLFWSSASFAHKVLTPAFSFDRPEILIVRGPFRYVRHPFYLCYLLTYFSVAILARAPWTFVCAVTMSVIYGWAAILEERKFKDSPLAALYARYRETAGMFFPKLGTLREIKPVPAAAPYDSPRTSAPSSPPP